MKPTMMLAIMALTAIVLMTGFDLILMPNNPVQISPEMLPHALYVCPASSNVWDSLANGFGALTKPIIIGFSFAFVIILATWAWALYQNLLKDKFNRDAFKNPWAYTKTWFWAVIIAIMILKTPNYFRTVHVVGDNRDWVLCESNTPGAKPVKATAVEL